MKTFIQQNDFYLQSHTQKNKHQRRQIQPTTKSGLVLLQGFITQ